MRKFRSCRGKIGLYIWGTLCVILLLTPLGRAENPWRIRINIPEYKLYLYRGVELYQSYPVAVGKADSPSPAGNYTIVNKAKNPTWYPTDGRPPMPPGPKNPLGKYWLGLNIDKYGIHGNSAPWSIGSPVSLGCFRMNNDDIKRLFEIIPVGTPVEVVYRTILGDIDPDGRAWLEVFPDIYRRENLLGEILNVFTKLHWTDEPHLRALQELLAATKRPAKIQAPRVIHMAGDITRSNDIAHKVGIAGVDGFFWKGAVYVSRNILAFLPVNGIHDAGNFLFNDYLDLQCLNTPAGVEITWNELTNTLNLDSASRRFLFEEFRGSLPNSAGDLFSP